MQEDVLGTRRTAISETYVLCARCNKATRLRSAQIIQSDVLSEASRRSQRRTPVQSSAQIIQSDVLSESHSEFEYLCPECQQALAEGEKDLPLA